MHSVLYIVVMVFVMLLLPAIPLFPFWKVWSRLKSHHPDIWREKGPFDVRSILSYSSIVASFMGIVNTAGRDEALKQKDPELVKWANGAREMVRMAPQSFLSQIGYVLIYIYFVIFLTSAIMKVLGS